MRVESRWLPYYWMGVVLLGLGLTSAAIGCNEGEDGGGAGAQPAPAAQPETGDGSGTQPGDEKNGSDTR